MLQIFLKIHLAWENKLIVKQVCRKHVPAERVFHTQASVRLTLVESSREQESAPEVLALGSVWGVPAEGLEFESCSCEVAVTERTGVGPTGTAAPPLPPAPGPAGPADTGPDAPWPYGPAEGGGGWPCCPHCDSDAAGTDPGPSPIPLGPGGALGLRRMLAVWARA